MRKTGKRIIYPKDVFFVDAWFVNVRFYLRKKFVSETYCC
jgi:hypothetical protein